MCCGRRGCRGCGKEATDRVGGAHVATWQWRAATEETAGQCQEAGGKLATLPSQPFRQLQARADGAGLLAACYLLPTYLHC